MLGWLRRRKTKKGHFARLDALDFPCFDPGTVWLVGAGPGGAGLISLLGYHALGEADVVVYDALVGPSLLNHVNPDAEKIFAGKRAGKPSSKQTDITLRLIELAKEGRRVVRLKGGDPMMFGRGGEEAENLARAGIKFRIVPGITAGVGGLAYAGIPVTHRDTNHAVMFLTGHDDKGVVPQGVDWDAVAKAAPVIVMYMAAKHLSSIAGNLMAAGRDPEDRIAIVSNASTPQQEIAETTLAQAHGLDQITTPAVIVIGPVSAYRNRLDWYVDSLRENGLG